MKQRTTTRALNTTTEPYLKYLKPGALARLRDSRIRFTARSSRVVDDSLPLAPISPPPPSSNDAQPLVNSSDDGFPLFAGRICYGPQCPQRKKLVAAKAALIQSVQVPDSLPDPVIDVFGSDSTSNIVVAH